MEKKTGIELIADERQRQIEVEGFTPDRDRKFVNGELADAARCYVMGAKNLGVYPEVSTWWPFDKEMWKPTPNDRIKELVKAGALIAAEIDRLINIE